MNRSLLLLARRSCALPILLLPCIHAVVVVAAVTSVVAITFAPAIAHADEKALAETLFVEGKDLMRLGKYEEACKRFGASHQADPSVGALLNLARCHQKIGKLASAWREFKEAAALAERARQPERKRGALEYATELEPSLSRLTVEVVTPVDGLEVKQGDTIVPPASYGVATPVDPGTFFIVASAPGYETWRTEVTVGADAEQATVSIPALTPRAVETPPEPPRDGGLHIRAIAGLGVAGVGVISLGVGIAFGAIAIDDESQLSKVCPNQRCSPQDLEVRDDIETKAHVSTATIIIGAAAIAGGAILFFTAPHDDPTEAALLPEVLPVPLVGPDFGGLGLAGRF